MGPGERRAAAAVAGRLALDSAGHVHVSAARALVFQHDADGQRAGVRRRETRPTNRSTIIGASIRAARRSWSKWWPPPTPWWPRPGTDTIKPADFPSDVKPRYDVVYLLDGRGWYYRYSHLDSIDPAVKPGARIKMGQKIGVLGKEGASGGWSHLHFDIVAPQPSGKYGISDAYAFFWQAYRAQYNPQLKAVARPHHLAWAGEDVVLDGSLSWSAKGPEHITSYQWTLSDGRKADGPTATRRYPV